MTMRRKRSRPAIEMLEGRALLTAGALDTTFGGTGVVTHDFGWSLPNRQQTAAIQPWDGKAVVTVPYIDGSSANGTPDFALTRYNPDGSIDTTFGKGGLATASFGGGGAILQAIAIDPTSHDIYGVGTGWGQQTVAVARFTPTGALDSTFGKGGEVTVGAGRPYTYNDGAAAAVDPSGRLVVAGNATTYDAKNYFYPSVGAIYRLTTAGALDKTFNGTGKVIAPYFDDNDGWNALQLEPSGSSYQIAVAGVYDQQNAMALFNASGGVVASFGNNGVATLYTNINDGFVFDFEPAGQLLELVQGGGPTWADSVIRYNANGGLDTTFGNGGQVTPSLPAGGGLTTLTVDLSGRIVLGGSDTVAGSNGRTNTKSAALLTRLTPSGALDTTFGDGGSVTQDFGAYGGLYGALAVYPAGASHAGELLAAGEDVVAPYPSPYDDLVLAMYQSDATATATGAVTASTVASPTAAATVLPTAGPSRDDPGIAPLVWDSPDFFDTLPPGRRRR